MILLKKVEAALDSIPKLEQHLTLLQRFLSRSLPDDCLDDEGFMMDMTHQILESFEKDARPTLDLAAQDDLYRQLALNWANDALNSHTENWRDNTIDGLEKALDALVADDYMTSEHHAAFMRVKKSSHGYDGNVKALVMELCKADIILHAMLNAMSLEQKTLVAKQLEASGVSPDAMIRANERQTVLALFGV